MTIEVIDCRVEKINDCLKCARCWKYTHDVGKIYQWPDICLRCADVMEIDVKEQRPDVYASLQKAHKDHPLRAMIPNYKAGDFDMVYMPEEVFREMYEDQLEPKATDNVS